MSFFKKYKNQDLCGIACSLCTSCRSPRMPVTGQGQMKTLVIAEAPGEQEDQKGIQLIGPAGQVLRHVLAEFGLDLDRDCRKTNAVRCRPPNNRKPTAREVQTCQPHIWEEIKTHPPKLILLLGQTALESFLLGHWKKEVGQIGRWRGFTIPDQKAECWVCPTYHPSYILRSQQGREIRGKAGDSVEEIFFLHDIENALKHLREPFSIFTIPEPEIYVTPIDSIHVRNHIAIDYETTGIKPFRTGHRIVSCGVCGDDGKPFAFPMEDKMFVVWRAILKDRDVSKIAHNMKFEHQWARHCLGVETAGWEWDTMLAAHVLDNRRGITSLKFQAYVNFGVADYAGNIQDTFDSDGGDGFNVLKGTAPTEELLRYNALDAFFCYKLMEKQRDRFS